MNVALAFCALVVCSRTEACWTFSWVCASATCWSPPAAGGAGLGTVGEVVSVDGVGTASKAATMSNLTIVGPDWQSSWDVEPVEAASPGSPVNPLEFRSGSFDEDTPTRVTPSMSSRDETKPATASWLGAQPTLSSAGPATWPRRLLSPPVDPEVSLWS